MSADSDKVELVERELDNRICLNIITLLALIFTAAFVLVTTMAFLNIQDLDAKDADLRLQIEELQQKLHSYRKSSGQIAEGAEELIEEVAQAALGGVMDEIDNHENGFKPSEDRSENAEEYLGRRQGIDIFSAILAAQRAVFEKYCVPHSTACPQGLRGANGTTGDAGLDGTNGPPGANGTKGIRGDMGNPGLMRDLGPQGPQGDQGANGRLGLIGDTGVWGEPGGYGNRGDPGVKGIQGEKGLKGSVGDTGPRGQIGPVGINGTKGGNGDTGIQGLKGDPGIAGPKGQDAKNLQTGCECYKKPTFQNPNDQTIVVGSLDQMVIPCVGEGNPAPTVTINKLPQKAGRKRAITQNGNIFTIDKPVSTEYGRYTCTATNVYGTATKVVTISQPSSGR